MRFNFFWASVCAIGLALPSSGQATLIDKGVFTTDTNTGLDWLKLSQIDGISRRDIQGGYGGYIYSGWRYATENDLIMLFSSYVGIENNFYYQGYDLSYLQGIPDGGAVSYFGGAEDLVLKLGMNLAFSDQRATVNIATSPDVHQIMVQGQFDAGFAEATAVISGDVYQYKPFGRWIVIEDPFDREHPGMSSYLIRESGVAVPEPTSWAMMIGGFGIAGGVLRRRQIRAFVSYA